MIGIVATDAEGNTKSMYRVIDAKFIEVNVENKTQEGKELSAGDTAKISFVELQCRCINWRPFIIRSLEKM